MIIKIGLDAAQGERLDVGVRISAVAAQVSTWSLISAWDLSG